MILILKYTNHPNYPSTSNRVIAIKAVRSITGASLKEAKDFTEGKMTYLPFIKNDLNVDDLKENVDKINRSGACRVLLGGHEWNHYADEINEMLFRAKMAGHIAVVTELERIKFYMEQHNGL